MKLSKNEFIDVLYEPQSKIPNKRNTMIRTYQLRLSGDDVYLEFNTFAIPKKEGESRLSPKEIDRILKLNVEKCNDKPESFNKNIPNYFFDGDWVYVSDNGNLLHCSDLEIFNIAKNFDKAIFNENGAMRAFDSSYEIENYKNAISDIQEAFYHPMLLNADQDKEIYSQVNIDRIVSLQKNGTLNASKYAMLSYFAENNIK